MRKLLKAHNAMGKGNGDQYFAMDRREIAATINNL